MGVGWPGVSLNSKAQSGRLGGRDGLKSVGGGSSVMDEAGRIGSLGSRFQSVLYLK